MSGVEKITIGSAGVHPEAAKKMQEYNNTVTSPVDEEKSNASKYMIGALALAGVIAAGIAIARGRGDKVKKGGQEAAQEATQAAQRNSGKAADAASSATETTQRKADDIGETATDLMKKFEETLENTDETVTTQGANKGKSSRKGKTKTPPSPFATRQEATKAVEEPSTQETARRQGMFNAYMASLATRGVETPITPKSGDKATEVVQEAFSSLNKLGETPVFPKLGDDAVDVTGDISVSANKFEDTIDENARRLKEETERLRKQEQEDIDTAIMAAALEHEQNILNHRKVADVVEDIEDAVDFSRIGIDETEDYLTRRGSLFGEEDYLGGSSYNSIIDDTDDFMHSSSYDSGLGMDDMGELDSFDGGLGLF